MQDGERVVFRQDAHQSPGATPGDVVIIISQKPHSVFNRRGSTRCNSQWVSFLSEIGVDLYTERKISLAEALGGFSFTLPLPNGNNVRILVFVTTCVYNSRWVQVAVASDANGRIISSGDVKVLFRFLVSSECSLSLKLISF